ncbi:hypothetical protein NLU13_2695 [Sarocladium strictum]|uniref:Uncharacterized protein n=1 Tax=Sarocladium strictum TaxID=5046 RepID=A0AA39L9Q4_SARSR|nr:hypothetical protein NLU13_2695 [Sarocladium strictum]
MAGHLSGGYFPLYPHRDDLDPDIRTFITNFYRASDMPNSNELWVSYFTQDAQVTMGNDQGQGVQEIRALRARMWDGVQSRKHTVSKVFPARFQHLSSTSGGQGGGGMKEEEAEHELMLFGEVQRVLKDGSEVRIPWATHAVVRKVVDGERPEWKLARYRA